MFQGEPAVRDHLIVHYAIAFDVALDHPHLLRGRIQSELRREVCSPIVAPVFRPHDGWDRTPIYEPDRERSPKVFFQRNRRDTSRIRTLIVQIIIYDATTASKTIGNLKIHVVG